MSTPYDNCFDHITDPVQRNSVRQQWLQMLDGGLSVADVRMLLDKYPDFQFAISRWIPCQPASLGFSYDTMDRLKEFLATLPEFKYVFDKYVSNLVSEPGKQPEYEKESKLNKLATIFPEFKQVAEKYIEASLKYHKEQREAAERERLERERRESPEERRERERKEYEYLYPDSDWYSEHRTRYL